MIKNIVWGYECMIVQRILWIWIDIGYLMPGWIGKLFNVLMVFGFNKLCYFYLTVFQIVILNLGKLKRLYSEIK